MICEKCEQIVDELFAVMYYNADGQMVCKECRDQAELQADYEYERQREERGEENAKRSLPKEE